MALTPEALREYVGAKDGDSAFLASVLIEAEALVSVYVGSAAVPGAIRDRATLEVGSELFHRRSAPQGVAQFATFDGPPVRVSRDPMVGAYPILRPWLIGIA